MSPQKRRPQARKGRTAAAAHKSRRQSDRTLSIVFVVLLVLGITLVFVLKPSKSTAGLQLGDHWHAALGVYACDHWDGGADWSTPVNPTTGGPVQANTTFYAALHSHHDGLIHMEPAASADTGSAADLGNYFKFNGFELSSTHVKFVSADLKNGDKCGTAVGTLHWLVNGKERLGDPTKYLLHDGDWIVVAFLPDSKKITSLGKPPSYKNLLGAEGRTNSTPTAPAAPTTTSKSTATSTPTSTSVPTSTT
jgi:hypothetical protein